MDEEAYEGREQSLVKHAVLRSYLARFARIVGTWNESITYIDAFAGPWSVKGENLSDSSFAIALEELRAGNRTLEARGKPFRIRCFFLETEIGPFQKLQTFARQAEDAEIMALRSSFENAVPEILTFIRRDDSTFTFLFIDPTGWTGFALETIRPLLKVSPGEVLVNFMTSFVYRFKAQDNLRAGFERLFGDQNFDRNLLHLKGHDLEECLVREYSRRVKEVGGFEFCCTAIVLHPKKDQTHFHLLYFTRSHKGVEVFKGAEKAAMKTMENVRAGVRDRKRDPDQLRFDQDFGLLTDPDTIRSRHYRDLRRRYLAQANKAVLGVLKAEREVPYLSLWKLALSFPLVWASDLKDWIEQWQTEEAVMILGLRPKESAPKADQPHRIRWTGT